MLTMCVLYVSLESRVTPNICVCVFMGSVLLSICRCSLVLSVLVIGTYTKADNAAASVYTFPWM